MNLFAEPDDHAIGRSRGGLSTKIHALVDGKGRPPVLLVAPGQGGDAPMLTHLMNQLKINRAGPGRPRTRPDRVRGDKAYSSRAIRTTFATAASWLSSRNHPIKSLTENDADPPEAGRRPSTNRTTKAGTSLNETSTSSSSGARWQHATTNSHSLTAAEPFSGPSTSGWPL